MRLSQNLSPGKVAWKRLRKDLWAMFALCYIALCLLIAIGGYAITPDSTPNADKQCLEIALAKPFTRVKFLKLRKNNELKSQGFFQHLLYGRNSLFTLIPVKSIEPNENKLIVNKYINYKKKVVDEIVFTIGEDGLDANNYTTQQRFWLGTDRFGRDVLSRMMIGTRITMMVGIIAVGISLLIGIILGSLAGYYRGWVDKVISWLINVTWSIPTLLLVLTITISIGKGLIPVFIAVGLTMWVDVARIVRGEIFSIREKDYVVAGKVLGFSASRIIFRHILPNVTASILVIASANFASAILIESGLSFLGLGAQPPTPTWGNMIESHRNFIITEHAHLAIIPGLAIMMLVLAFTMLSNGLKNAIQHD